MLMMMTDLKVGIVEVEVAKVEAEVMVVLMVLNPIATMVISSFFPGDSKNSITKNLLSKSSASFTALII